MLSKGTLFEIYENSIVVISAGPNTKLKLTHHLIISTIIVWANL